MALYELFIKRSAEKEIRALETKDRKRVVARILSLKKGPRGAGCEKLSGRDAYRVRVGSFRIVYTIDDGRLIIEIVAVADRKEVYR